MARRWLLTILTGTALSIGLAGTASAQELAPVDAGVAQATVSADTTERTLEAELSTDVQIEELDTDVSPVVTAEVTEEGPDLDAEGPVEVAGTPLPVQQVVAQVEDAAEVTTTPDQTAAGSEVAPAPAPAPAPATAGPAPVAPAAAASQAPARVSHSRTLTADRAEARGLRAAAETYTLEESVPAPEIAPPADELSVVAAAAPVAAPDLSLPIIDTTPTVPALLRLLAGLLVVGAAATWQTVRNELT